MRFSKLLKDLSDHVAEIEVRKGSPLTREQFARVLSELCEQVKLGKEFDLHDLFSGPKESNVHMEVKIHRDSGC